LNRFGARQKSEVAATRVSHGNAAVWKANLRLSTTP
jgi:hypothetical protein